MIVEKKLVVTVLAGRVAVRTCVVPGRVVLDKTVLAGRVVVTTEVVP